jgi:signal transduction histidine kinase/ActR/RegA family two-component response regulator
MAGDNDMNGGFPDERLRFALEAAPGGMILTDAAGRILFANARAETLLGYDRGEMVGLAVQRVVEKNLGRRKDGSEFPIDTATHTLGSDGDAVVLHSIVDVTEREEAGRRKDEFLAMLAHELRNPLAPIRNAVQVMRILGLGNPDLEWAREVVDRQVTYLSRLVDDLLDVSRVTSGRIALRKERVALAGLVARAVESSRHLVDAKGQRLSVKLPPRPVELEADPTRLVQVLENLLDNAAKFTEQGGRIALAVEVDGREVVIRVRDTGIGIPPSQLANVFDLFAQGPSTLGRIQGGLGIGLTLVRRIVELHGGTVSATSPGPRLGSEFVVRLPAAPARVAPSAPAAAAPSVAASRCRILVVDDNVDSAETLAMMLQFGGHDVRVVHDGQSALRAAREQRPNVVLLDLGLPDMDGYEVAEHLRRDPEAAGVVLVAVTGYGQEEHLRRSREVGFNHHLVKPVDPSALDAVLATVPRSE